MGLILITVDGTASSEWLEKKKNGRFNSHVRNFFEDYKLKPGEKKAYWHGPKKKYTGADAISIHRGVVSFLEENFCLDVCQKINLIGHSRGGYIVMEVAREIKNKGLKCSGKIIKCRVNFLGLYDAVDMVLGYGKDETVPSNVDYSMHVMGQGNVKSRPYFNTADHGAEGLSEMKSYAESYVDATHGGIGGDPWGGDHPKGMTEERDIAGSAEADRYMRAAAIEAGIEFK